MVGACNLPITNLDICSARYFLIFMFPGFNFLQDGLDDSTVILSDENRKVSNFLEWI
jgi:hypothetical protein